MGFYSASSNLIYILVCRENLLWTLEYPFVAGRLIELNTSFYYLEFQIIELETDFISIVGGIYPIVGWFYGDNMGLFNMQSAVCLSSDIKLSFAFPMETI